MFIVDLLLQVHDFPKSCVTFPKGRCCIPPFVPAPVPGFHGARLRDTGSSGPKRNQRGYRVWYHGKGSDARPQNRGFIGFNHVDMVDSWWFLWSFSLVLTICVDLWCDVGSEATNMGVGLSNRGGPGKLKWKPIPGSH